MIGNRPRLWNIWLGWLRVGISRPPSSYAALRSEIGVCWDWENQPWRQQSLGTESQATGNQVSRLVGQTWPNRERRRVVPSTSKKQESLMRAIAHGWKPDRLKSPPSVAVAKEFVQADQAKKSRRKSARKKGAFRKKK